MAKKSIKKAAPKSKKSPKVGSSKKVKTKNHSKANKKTATAKALSTENKLNKKIIAEKKAKAKKRKTEVKKPATKLKKIKAKAKKPGKVKSRAKTEKNLIPGLIKQANELLAAKKAINEREHMDSDPSRAAGKKHLHYELNGAGHPNFAASEFKTRPEAYGKRGRSSSPRATFPTN